MVALKDVRWVVVMADSKVDLLVDVKVVLLVVEMVAS